MNAAHVLAWLCVGWPIFYQLIDWADKPITFHYNSLAYHIADILSVWGKFTLGIMVLIGALSGGVLATVVLALATLMIVWTIVGHPVDSEINNYGTTVFLGLVAMLVGVAMIVLSIIVL